MTSLAEAQRVLCHRGSTFAMAARLLPAPYGAQVARLYAACRAVDDLADLTDGADAAERLECIRRQLAARQATDPIAAEFLDLARDAALDLDAAVELVDGVRGDLNGVRVADAGELLRYADAVAGTVGRMMAGLFGAISRHAAAHAVDLGIAMQLTNIARDVLEDARLGRRYLPATWCALTPEELAAAPATVRPQAAAAVLALLSLADRFYASGLAGLGHLPMRPRLAVSVAASVYREIGTVLRERQGSYWEGRVVVPQWRRIAVAGMAVMRALRAKAPREVGERALSAALADTARLRQGLDHASA